MADRVGAGGAAAGAGAGRPPRISRRSLPSDLIRGWTPVRRQGYAPTLSVLHQPLELGAEIRRDVLARQRVGDVGGEEADLRAAVKTLAGELEAEERLRLGQAHHAVGELDLAAGAARLVLQDGKDLRLQDVAARDAQTRGRLLALRLLYHLRDLERLADARAHADDAVHVHALGRHLLDRDHVRVASGLAIDLHHLGE